MNIPKPITKKLEKKIISPDNLFDTKITLISDYKKNISLENKKGDLFSNAPINIYSSDKSDLTLLTLSNEFSNSNNKKINIHLNCINDLKINKTFGELTLNCSNVKNKQERTDFNINLLNSGKIVNSLKLYDDGELHIKRIYESSDERIKENIKINNNEESFNKLLQLPLKKYNYIKDKSQYDETITYTGVLAQDVKKIFPSSISIIDNGFYEDFHTISTNELLYHTIGAIQHLKTLIK